MEQHGQGSAVRFQLCLHCLMEQHGQGSAVCFQLCLHPWMEQPLTDCQACCCCSRVVCNVKGVREISRLNLALKVVFYDLKKSKKFPVQPGDFPHSLYIANYSTA